MPEQLEAKISVEFVQLLVVIPNDHADEFLSVFGRLDTGIIVLFCVRKTESHTLVSFRVSRKNEESVIRFIEIFCAGRNIVTQKSNQ